MKAANPLVMCVTNRVTPQRVADVLLAAGASPAMIDNPDEVGQFAGLADLIGGGLYLNTGLHATQMGAIGAVGEWRKTSPDGVLVVDPVGFGATAYRNDAITKMLSECRPEVIKGNASEIVGLSGVQGDGKGVDAGATRPEQCVDAARSIAAAYASGAISITGPSDAIVEGGDSGRVAFVADGDGGAEDKGRMLTLVTGTGCSLGALIAATTAASRSDPFVATVRPEILLRDVTLFMLHPLRPRTPLFPLPSD
jgi:hydroxyethylthiazole kinase